MTENANITNTMETPSDKEFPKSNSWVFLAILLIWGYTLVHWFPLPYLGIRLTLFALSAAGIFYAYLRASGKTPAKTSYLYLGAAAFLSISFSLFENSGIEGPLFLLLPCLFACWLLHAAGDRPLSGRDIPDTLSLLALKPFTGLREKGSLFSVKEKSRSQAKYAVIGIVITVPVFLIALFLLSSADQHFDDVVSKILGSLSEDLGTLLARVVAACVIAAYLLSLLISASRPKEKGEAKPLPQANGTVMSILIGALCALYAAFVIMQIMSVMGVFANGQERGAAFYSEYARDGFFELCQVAVLNLAVFLVAHIFRRTATNTMRNLLTALGVLTMALVITAIAKMGLYMGHFGLTLLRVQTMWFMVSLFVVFGVLIALQWKHFAGFQAIAVFAVCSVLAASCANIGGIVASVNVNRYLDGSLDTIDCRQYWQFPYEAAPHLIRLYKGTGSLEVKRETGSFLLRLSEITDVGWVNKSVQRLLAESEVTAFLAEYPQEPVDTRSSR